MNDLTAFFLLVGRLLLGVTFILAGTLKVQAGSRRFLRQVLAYNLVQGRVARLLAGGLPWLEIGCGLCLLLGFLLPPVTVVSFILLLSFTLAIGIVMMQEKRVDCGCFGRSQNPVRWRLAYRNLALMGLLAALLTFGPGRWTVDQWLFDDGLPFAALQEWLIATWTIILVATAGLHLLTQSADEQNERQYEMGNMQ